MTREDAHLFLTAQCVEENALNLPHEQPIFRPESQKADSNQEISQGKVNAG